LHLGQRQLCIVVAEAVCDTARATSISSGSSLSRKSMVSPFRTMRVGVAATRSSSAGRTSPPANTS
jgi:hypothetical protein